MADLRDRLQEGLADRYRLDRELGRGGMATVYLARDLKHDRPVALKVLHPELANGLGPERFLREIHLTARLDHPHILPVLDSGAVDQLLWYTMPYVRGETLRELLRRETQLGLEEAITLTRQVAGALDYAHREGVVHRDLKPENIMIADGQARVADFGVARALAGGSDGEERLTRTGVAVGTPLYMSPEQAAGGTVDGRSDVYALGCVLYEMLAGEPPFTGATPQTVIARRMLQPPLPVTQLRPGVPMSVDRAITRALAPVPADRFATPGEFARALDVQVAATETRPRAILRRPWGWAVATGLVVAAVGAWWTSRSSAKPHPSPSVGILPFANLSDDPEKEYLSDGMTEEVIAALAKIQGLRVPARTSTFALKGRNEDVHTIGRQLNVSTVLEGSVRQAGTRLRVTAQLVNVSDGYQMWSEVYDRPAQDLVAVQEQIAQAIVGTLEPRLLPRDRDALVRHARCSPEAYDRYLRGRYQASNSFRRPDQGAALRTAITSFEEALGKDPRCASAYAGIAAAYSFLADDVLPPHEAEPKAKAAAERAVALDSSLAEAYGSLGVVLHIYEWDWVRAEAALKRAIQLSPSSSGSHLGYANLLLQRGRTEEALREAALGRELDPLSIFADGYAANLMYLARQYDRTIEQSLETIAKDSTDAYAHTNLGLSYAQQGRLSDAVAELKKGAQLSGGNPLSLGYLGYAYARSGDRAEALGIASRLKQLSQHQYVIPDAIARVYIGLGDRDEAFRWIDRAVEARSAGLLWLVLEANADPVRSDPRFDKLLKELGW
jgi:eukaryotic-like serine/threonine-protein kinase